MITYLYWLLVAIVIFAAFFAIGVRLNQWKAAFVVSVILLLVGSSLYYFRFQQVFVKRWGGTMTITVPDGEEHIATTWKGDNLWVENYNPEDNTCIFREYSRGNVLQGHVRLKDCNPVGYRQSAPPSSTPQSQ